MAKSGLFCTHDVFQRSDGQSAVIVKDKAEKPALGHFKFAANDPEDIVRFLEGLRRGGPGVRFK